jgi:monoamine oxidase
VYAADGIPGSEDAEATTVVIVGAGAAGLSAARQLLKEGVTDIVVVEAQGRIGGRIKQVRIPALKKLMLH